MSTRADGGLIRIMSDIVLWSISILTGMMICCSQSRELREELYGAKMEDYLEKFPRRDLIFRTIRNEVF